MFMQVSAKKSKVVASKPSIAQAVVEHTSNDRVSAVKLAKLLGTDTVGGSADHPLDLERRWMTSADMCADTRPLGS